MRREPLFIPLGSQRPAPDRCPCVLSAGVVMVVLAAGAAARSEAPAKVPRRSTEAVAAPERQAIPAPFTTRIHSLVNGLADLKSLPQARAELLAIGRDATPVLITRYQDPSFTVRWQMVDIAGELRDARAIPVLVDRILRDEDPHVRWRGMYALAEFEDAAPGLAILLPALKGTDPRAAYRAALALAFLRRPDGLALIHAGLKSEDPWERWESIESLSKVHDASSVELLANVLTRDTPRERQQAVMSLSEIGGPRARDALVAALADEEPAIRWRACMVLGISCSPGVVSAMKALIERETDPEVLSHARETLVACTTSP